MLLALTFFVFICCVAVCLIDWGEAKQLNLTICGGSMAKINDTFTATIAPTNVAGAPANVTDILWTAGAGYDLVVAADGMSATVTAIKTGVGNSISVSARAKSGTNLSETVALPDVEADPEEAVKLNLALA